jgi:integrase
MLFAGMRISKMALEVGMMFEEKIQERIALLNSTVETAPLEEQTGEKQTYTVEEIQELFGDEYRDYGLVFCSTTGTPIEGAVINRAFSKLIQDNKLPKVVFHSLRHIHATNNLH